MVDDLCPLHTIGLCDLLVDYALFHSENVAAEYITEREPGGEANAQLSNAHMHTKCHVRLKQHQRASGGAQSGEPAAQRARAPFCI
jgi:hypothetical protein